MEEAGVSDNQQSQRLLAESIKTLLAQSPDSKQFLKDLIQDANSTSLDEDFEETGPYEPITRRLRNILKEYKEGVGVFKELIQNADDAGARKVCFLVDWREGPKGTLLSPKMAECQGPALWAYNDAVFTVNDLENINKVAGETKVEELDKIGRFGLGFNAVYHLTDVPSFVSGEHCVIFDPNANHLQNKIKDKSRPGIRINLARNPGRLTTFEDQFQPYHNVFGCDTQRKESSTFHYNGTLFRFPFRTPQEASESDICERVYDQKKVEELAMSLKKCASLLLLFSQNVNEVELYELARDSSDLKLVLSVTKSHAQENGRETKEYEVPFIKECATWWKKMLSPCKKRKNVAGPSRSELFTIVTKVMVSDLISCTEESVKQDWWLVASCVGTGSSVQIAREEDGRKHGLLPCAGAAFQLEDISTSRGSLKLQAATTEVSGEAFCFLPLSIPTGLPVQVNGYFAIMSNRMEIWKRDTSDRIQPVEVRWNESVLEDALANAYIKLLEYAKRLSQDGVLDSYVFHSSWPCYNHLPSTTWGILVNSVYKKLVRGSLPLLCSDGKWLSINNGYVLDDQLVRSNQLRNVSVDILKQLHQSVFLVPAEVFTALEESGHRSFLSQRSLNLEKFLTNYLFPNITKISPKKRDAVVGFALDYILPGDGGKEMESIEDLLKSSSCITVSQDGRHLAKPCELINPNGSAANLFSAEDRRFPVGGHILSRNRVYVLERLGMISDKLPWQEILERAKSVEQLLPLEKGRKRARNLITYLKENIEEYLHMEDRDALSDALRNTRFLPFLSDCPDDYYLPWRGSLETKRFAAPVNVFFDLNLVGSTCLIIDESSGHGCGPLGQSVKHFLGFSERNPEVKMVMKQLDAAIDTWHQLSVANKRPKKDMVESVCRRVYKYFEGQIKNKMQRKHDKAVDYLVTELRQRPWLFIQGRFVSSKLVAYDWSGSAAPFIYGLPSQYHGKYDDLLRAVGLKQSFDATDFIEALYALKKSKAGGALTDEELKITECLLRELVDTDGDDVRLHIGRIPLPDLKKILHRSDELTINQTPWLDDHGDVNYVHANIPPQLSLDLGAKSLQERKLEPYSSGIGTPFGQHEDLTERLENILKGYPCGPGILKELVQNADDAQATEIHFIHDTRALPHERVFLENAEEVQGPALCIYNDRPFTKEDLYGIQKLGIGSKRDNPLKTGQYGIGFNSVYHLTDCPSFLSNGDTLCFLDPHCRYVPGATSESPGRQFHPIDQKFKKDHRDILSGYLGQHLKLKGGTVFRLPLRSEERSHESSIAPTDAINSIEELLSSFKRDAKKMLLFLIHVKKISLSVVKESGEMVQEYVVTAILNDESETRRKELTSFMTKYKEKPTNEVRLYSNTYPMDISDSNGNREKWLIHQCYGTVVQNEDDVIPDGRPYGLLPRGGIAALVSSPHTSTTQDHPEYVAYCFLPLPEGTGLPVHVNGHFALDTARRSLWRDDAPNGYFTRWNKFIKSRILAPGYSSLIIEAQKYIPNCQEDSSEHTRYFRNESAADTGLSWYHELFPNLTNVTREWKVLAVEVYRILATSEHPVLPIVDNGVTENGRIMRGVSSNVSFFVDYDDPENPVKEELMELLLRVGHPLLRYSPKFIYNGFQAVHGDASRLITPKTVIDFLRTPDCKLEKLPRKLKDTKVRSVSDLERLIRYCKKETKFFSLLDRLPLLLTADGNLRMFDTRNPVYCSEFSDLFPSQTHVFVHPKIVQTMSSFDRKESHVMPKLSVHAVARFMPNIFPQHFRGTNNHESWVFRNNGVLSEQWFKRLWEFLQNAAEPEGDEEQVSLKALGEWPILPTTSGELVTIDNAKTVLDLTETGTEIAREKKVRKFLKRVQCPSLNKAITLDDSTATSSLVSRDSCYVSNPVHEETTASLRKKSEKKGTVAVTDPYVAHPYSVPDVLHVLDHMRKTGTLNVSKLPDEEILEILLFFQDEYEESYNEILKQLPLYKTIDGTRVSLSAFSFYAVVPEGVPLAEISEIQRHTGCLFLHSDALPVLNKLYMGLGIGTQLDVWEFYILFILPYFSVFCRESQIQFLVHIRDKVLPYLPDTSEFRESMKTICCIPDEAGHLHRAQEFFHPNVEIFQTMLDDIPNQFPPQPFDEEEWLVFLRLIGLKTVLDEQQFLKFCRSVESRNTVRMINRSWIVENVKRSKALVKYFFQNTHLHSSTFLRSVSTIKFIASERVEDKLTTLHDEYQCKGDKHPPYVQFSGSLPWYKRNLVWTSSSSLLPTWADPGTRRQPLTNKKVRGLPSFLSDVLRVLKDPTEDTVIDNLRNISNTLTKRMEEGSLPNPVLIKPVMHSIYSFLSSKMECPHKDISMQCTNVCKKIGRRLQDVPCVFIEEDENFVKGDQLSFNVPGENPLHPFISTVSREYAGKYEHFLKRLGATEKISSFQVVNVLTTLKHQCKEEKMDSDVEQKAGICMYFLFSLIVDDGGGLNEATPTELFLPSEDQFLIKSDKLVCQVSSRLDETVRQLYHVLLPFRTCGLPRERECDYINALPERMRPHPLNNFVREGLDPSCMNDTCCSGGTSCSFIQRYIDNIGSKEFQEGILRLMKHQDFTVPLDKMKERSSRFRNVNTSASRGSIQCMTSIKMHLVRRETDLVIEGSSNEHICSVVKEGNSWKLYVTHDSVAPGVLSKFLNEIIDYCLNEKCLSALGDMLSCSSPEKMARVVDFHEIDKDFSDGKIAAVTKGLLSEFEMLKAGKPNVSSSSYGRSGSSYGGGSYGGGGGGGGRWGPGGTRGQRIIRTEYLLPDDDYTTPDPEEAKRWMKQSRFDQEAAKFLLAGPPYYALVCFLSHQIVEKSLKAALYAKQGLTGEQLHTHNVTQLAVDLENGSEIIRLARCVASYYLTTRYPNRQPHGKVPAEQFGKAEATTAVDNTGRLLSIL